VKPQETRSSVDAGLPLPVRVEDYCMVDTTRQMPENAEWPVIFDKIYKRHPVPVQQIMPPGLAESNGSGRSGAVMVKAFIDSTGKVIRACIISSTATPGFETASLRAAMQWTFTPAEGNHGQPLGCWVTIPFRTKIK
jgi:TonB family protein